MHDRFDPEATDWRRHLTTDLELDDATTDDVESDDAEEDEDGFET